MSKIKSKLSGQFSGLGEIVAPFSRIFPNVGAVISAIVNASTLPVNLSIERVGNGFKLNSLALGLSGIDTISSLVTNSEDSICAVYSAERDGGAWDWLEEFNSANSNPFTKPLTIGSLVNQAFNPSSSYGDMALSGVECDGVIILQGLERVVVCGQSVVTQIHTDASLTRSTIGEFESASIGFGE